MSCANCYPLLLRLTSETSKRYTVESPATGSLPCPRQARVIPTIHLKGGVQSFRSTYRRFVAQDMGRGEPDHADQES